MDTRKKIELLLTPGVKPAQWDMLQSDVDIDEAIGRLKLTSVPKALVDRQLNLVTRAGARVLMRWEDEFPASLRPVPMCPPGLFVRGRLPAKDAPAVAIVGTRKPSVTGIRFAREMARTLALLGIAVVSGMARGIDTAAHEGALGADGLTVAVLGTGVDVVYPPENDDLMRRIAADGGVVSEQPCGTAAFRGVFPRRNRIISGISDAVVVVEGGTRSGALITARWALEQGREVGAVPGFPGSFRSEGPNQLLKQGAFVVTDATDVITHVKRIAERVSATVRAESDDPAALIGLDGDAARVFGLLANPAGVDEVAVEAGISIERAQGLLTLLEIEGRIYRDSGGNYARFERRERA
jgi:DNA processing protein